MSLFGLEPAPSLPSMSWCCNFVVTSFVTDDSTALVKQGIGIKQTWCWISWPEYTLSHTHRIVVTLDTEEEVYISRRTVAAFDVMKLRQIWLPMSMIENIYTSQWKFLTAPQFQQLSPIYIAAD